MLQSLHLGQPDGLASEDEQIVVVTHKEHLVHLFYYEIKDIECINRRIHFRIVDGKEYATNQIRTAFSDYVAPFLTHAAFIQPHQSFVVNANYVREMTSAQIILKDERIIPLSKKRKKEVYEKYWNYMTEHHRPIE